MTPTLLAIETEAAGLFQVLRSAGARGWESTAEPVRWADLPDKAFRPVGRPHVAVAARANPPPWNLPAPVAARIRASVWRYDPAAFAFGRASGAGVEWLVQPPPPVGEVARLELRTRPNPGDWQNFDPVLRRSVVGQVEAYQTVVRALAEAASSLNGRIQADLTVNGERVQLSVEFRHGKAFLNHVAGIPPEDHPSGPSHLLALDMVTGDRPPLPAGKLNETREWVWGQLTNRPHGRRWQFEGADALAARVVSQGSQP